MSKLFRKTDALLICVMVAAAAFTYKTKHDAEAMLSEVRRLENQIRFEEDTMTVLRADWSLLTQPSRLQKLAETYKEQLGLGPVETTQIGDLAGLPPRPLTVDQLLQNGIADLDTDPLMTGGIKP